MKAAVRSKYGTSKVLHIAEVEKPIPKDDEVLVRVHATTVNRSDCHVLTGRPLFMHLFTGFFKPKMATTGTDFTGEIESLGKEVQSFKVGDKVMGFGGALGIGTHAEYVTYPVSKGGIMLMPGNLTFQQAAACLEGAYYATSGLQHLKPRAGQKALVRGATGAIGSSQVQLLKYYGLYVTAVCGGENRELVLSLGADKIIDYKTEDFTQDNEQYDFVFDNAGKSRFGKCKRLLKKKGLYSPSNGLHNFLLAMITPLFGGKKVVFPVPSNLQGNLLFIRDLIERGIFKPVIDRVYPLERIAEAYDYVMTGEKIGNVILKMD